MTRFLFNLSLSLFLQVRIWGQSPASAQRCANEVGAKVSTSLPDALKDADVVVTVTLAMEPLVRGEWLKPGAVVICESLMINKFDELNF